MYQASTSVHPGITPLCPQMDQSSCIFLNRMLELLRDSQNTQRITLTSDFRCDICWFAKFLPNYNGINFYDHRNVDHVTDLDAHLTVWEAFSAT